MGTEDDEKAKAGAAKAEPAYLGQAVRDFEERLAPRLEEARAQFDQLNGRVKTYIRANPGTSLLCALGVGYLIGKLASRR